MEYWTQHVYVVPQVRANIDTFSAILERASQFPNTIIPQNIKEHLFELRDKNLYESGVFLGVKIDGILLNILYDINFKNIVTNKGHVEIDFDYNHWFPDGYHPPGKDSRLQSLLKWFFKELDALYMAAWGQNDEFSLPCPDSIIIESINSFPAGLYMLSNELLGDFDRDRLAALGPHGDIDGAGMWLMFRDDYYWTIDDETNQRKTAVLEEIWERWKNK